jgi:Ca2+-binding RTX toxin-like protein
MSDVVSNTDPTALLGGNYWNGIEVTGTPVIVTFSFPTTAPAYDSSVPGFTPATIASFTPFTAAEQTQAINALTEWANASGLVFLEVAPGQGQINFQNVSFSTTTDYAGYGGIGFYPFGQWNSFSYPNYFAGSGYSGNVFMNSDFISGGTVDYGTMLHETGHAIGLKHPTEIVTDYAALPAPVVHNQVLSADDPTLTVMATVGDTSSAGNVHLKPLDQAAAADIYGAAGTGGLYTASASGSNSVSSWSWNASTETLTQHALQTNEAVEGTSANDIIYGMAGDKLYGLDGNDTLIGAGGGDSLFGGPGADVLEGGGNTSFYVDSTATTVTETNTGATDTAYSYVSFTLPTNVDTLYLYGSGLIGTGNNAADTMFGDGSNATTLIGGSAGGDYIVGGSGNDTIAPSQHDLVFGNGGNNLYIIRTAADLPTSGGATTIGDFVAAQDRIDLAALTASNGHPLHFIGTAAFSDTPGEVRDTSDGTYTYIQGDLTGAGTPDIEIELYGTPSLTAADFVFSAACFRAGTRILTDRGEIRVEDLAAGDRVVTAAGAARPIQWIGYRHVDCRRHPRPRDVWPIRVRADAFAPGLPVRDLLLSPDHAIYVDQCLVPIRYLANGASIVQEEVASVTYFHIELETHDILVADGLPAETYLDTGNRSAFANGGAAVMAHPDFAFEVWAKQSCAKLLVAGPDLIAIRRRVLARVPNRLTAAPDLALRANGRRLTPDREGRYRLPPGAALHLASRHASPAETDADSADHRRLGVGISRLFLDGLPIALDDPRLTTGWHAPERGLRWTDGNAVLDLPAGGLLEVTVAMTTQYWLTEPTPHHEAARAG